MILAKRDPRVKLCLAVCLSTMAILFNQLSWLLGLLLLTGLLVVVAGGHPGTVWRRLKSLLLFMVLLSLLQSICNHQGEVLVAWGSWVLVTDEGLKAGIVFFCRMLILLGGGILIATAGSRPMIQGLVAMKVPYELAFMTSVGLLFLPFLRDDFKNSLTAIQLRGLDWQKISWSKKWQIYSYLFFPVIIRSINRAKEMSLAMDMLAFRKYPTRTSYLLLKMQLRDWCWVALAVIGSCLAIVFYWGR